MVDHNKDKILLSYEHVVYKWLEFDEFKCNNITDEVQYALNEFYENFKSILISH